jgi:lipoprotein-anchoring transpeptidase ErfK/SrfK
MAMKQLPARAAAVTKRLPASAHLVAYVTTPHLHGTLETIRGAVRLSWRAAQHRYLKVVAASALLMTIMTGSSVIRTAQTVHPAVASMPASGAARQQLDLVLAFVLASTPIPDTETCHVANTTRSMLTPQQIAHPVSHGYRLNPGGNVVPCAVHGLQVPAAPKKVGQHGQVILVSTHLQWLWAYQDGKLVYATPVTTGMAPLRTPHGTYTIMLKESDVTFYSPWPRGSPYYYTPEHVDYALRFRAGGFYIHNAPWRGAFGPGTQDPHTNPDGTHETGSHGCVNVTTGAARWLYSWARVGATVIIV